MTGEKGSLPNDYDAFAAAYSADNDGNLFNAFYERPATLDLVGEVDGLRVLDAGCGGGAHAAALVARGATVTGLDVSTGLLAVARARLGSEVELVHADLADPLPLPSEAFDVVVASLVLHYLEDWSRPLAELRRVLLPGGRLVVSTHHPAMDDAISGVNSYLSTYQFEEVWHRPLHAMTDAFAAAGFLLERVVEPQPDPAGERLDPTAYERLTREARFIWFSLRAVG